MIRDWPRTRATEATKSAPSLTGLDDHAFAAFVWSLELDTRTRRSTLIMGSTTRPRSPSLSGGVGTLTDTWGRTFFALRAYRGFFGERLVLAGRVVFDILTGTPPVYELSRFDNYSNAFGGEKGIRGIEAQRYYGKVKLFANFESRISLFEFDLIGHQTLIFTQFFRRGPALGRIRRQRGARWLGRRSQILGGRRTPPAVR